MKEKLIEAMAPCKQGHCGMVEITRMGEGLETRVLWCRYCGRIEVYEDAIEDGVITASRCTVNLTAKIFQIVKEHI